MNPSKRLLPALLALAVYCASTAAVSAITITSNSASVYLRSNAGNGTDTLTDTNIVPSQLLDVTRGDYYSRTQIDFTGSGDNVTLLNTFTQKRSVNGLGDGFSHGTDELYFTAGANSTYSLSGAYSVSDVGNGGFLYFYSQLYDLTSSTYLEYSFQESLSMNQSFVLGGNVGDTNSNFGSLTGSLIAGHQYQWLYHAYTEAAYPGPDFFSATATGFVQLDIGGGASSSSVPDGGSTLTMLGLTVLSFAAYRRKALRA